jgi:hypothetical protein
MCKYADVQMCGLGMIGWEILNIRSLIKTKIPQ